VHIGKRLHLRFTRASGDPATDDAAAPRGPSKPLVDFVAYGEDEILSGRVRLNAERLTDLLNANDEILLTDVLCQRLDNEHSVEVREVLVPRDDLLLVHATGPRGNQQRRQRTRALPMAFQTGPYHVRGYLHTTPGTDPLLHLRRRRPMVPLTEAWIEYTVGSNQVGIRVSGVIVNRELIDWIVPATDEEIEFPEMPVTAAGPLVKDFTGQIFG